MSEITSEVGQKADAVNNKVHKAVDSTQLLSLAMQLTDYSLTFSLAFPKTECRLRQCNSDKLIVETVLIVL